MPTVRLADHLEPEYLLWGLPPVEKPELLKRLAAAVAERLPELDEAELLGKIQEREATQSTGIGLGVAMPHAAIGGLARTVLFVGQLAAPVAYDSLDGAPVDLVFLLLSPPAGLSVHVRLLARLARLIGQTALTDKLRMAAEARIAYRLLVEEDARHVY
jgi:PTS system nitrogen regulatory IIA component